MSYFSLGLLQSGNDKAPHRAVASDEARYRELMDAWHEAVTALKGFPLFEDGKVRCDRRSEYRHLRRQEMRARNRVVELMVDHFCLDDLDNSGVRGWALPSV